MSITASAPSPVGSGTGVLPPHLRSLVVSDARRFCVPTGARPEPSVSDLLDDLQRLKRDVQDWVRRVESKAYPDVNDRVFAAVADEFGVTVEALRGRSRIKPIAIARQAVMVLLYQLHRSCTIAAGIIGRDHGTILHANRALHDRMDVDPKLRDRFARAAQRVGITEATQ